LLLRRFIACGRRLWFFSFFCQNSSLLVLFFTTCSPTLLDSDKLCDSKEPPQQHRIYYTLFLQTPPYLYCSSGSENYFVRCSTNGWEFSSLRSSNNKGDDRCSFYCSSAVRTPRLKARGKLSVALLLFERKRELFYCSNAVRTITKGTISIPDSSRALALER